MIRRFSSRLQKLDTSFINERLKGAVTYVFSQYVDSIWWLANQLSGDFSDEPIGIYDFFGQIPDVLEDVWIDVANGEIENTKKLIDSVKPKHPFDERYNQITEIDWESCSFQRFALKAAGLEL